LVTTMSASDPRDRSQEFFSTVAVLKKQMQQTSLEQKHMQPNGRLNGVGNSAPSAAGAAEQKIAPAAPLTFAQQTQFTQAAKHISGGIIGLTEKLEHLGKLAKQRSLFKDPVLEINKLTFNIKQEITTLNKDLDMLQSFVMQNRERGFGTKENAENSQQIVGALQRDLVSATVAFSGILKERQTNLKEGSKRRKEFEGASGQKLKRRPDTFAGSLSLDDAELSESQVALLDGDHKDSGANGTMVERKEQVTVLVEPVEEDTYYQSRADALGEIEKTIVELAEMYKRLTGILAMHEETAERIDQRLFETNMHLEGAHGELIKAADTHQAQKWLMIKIFAVVMAFTVLWAVIR